MCLCVADDGVILEAGPIWARKISVDSGTVSVNAAGVWSYFRHRFILPTLAAALPTTQFIVPDPSDPTKTVANPALATNLLNLSLGTIAKKIVQQALSWVGGNPPIIFQPDEIGAQERNWQAVDFKSVGGALSDLTGVENGPDIRFEPRFTTDSPPRVEWVMRTGTDAEPEIFSPLTARWDVGTEGSSVSDLEISEDGSKIASLAWLTASRATSGVLTSRAYDPTLVGYGSALFEDLDTSHSSVELQGTLDGWANEAVKYGRSPSEVWSFTVDADESPTVGSYSVGDFCELALPDPLGVLPAGVYRRRIIQRSGTNADRKIKIYCAPVRGQ
jgi:hypothetical protein